MPIIQAYKGSIKVEGASYKGPVDGESGRHIPFYSDTVQAYGETPGELMDALVEASVQAANNLFEWRLLNRPADYTLDSDVNEYWYVQLVHPDYATDLKDASAFSEVEDTGSGSAFYEVEAIVRHAVLARDIEVKHFVVHFSLLNPGGQVPTKIPQEPAVSYKGCYKAESLQEITKFGWTGIEFDSILAIAEEEGRLAAYRANRKYARRKHEADRKTRVAQAKVGDSKSRLMRWLSGEVHK